MYDALHPITVRRMDRTKLDLAKMAAREELRGIQGVEGVGIGDGRLRVYVLTPDVAAQVPPELLGVPVECIVSGAITPLGR